MSKDPRARRQVGGHAVRGYLAHRLALRKRPTMWRIFAERPPVREATVWLLSAHHGQHSLQPSSFRLVLSATFSRSHLSLAFGRR